MHRYKLSAVRAIAFVILGSLAIAAVYASLLSGLPKSMRSLACAEDLAALYGAIETYRGAHDGHNPPSLQALEDSGLMPALEGWDGKPFFTSKGGPGFVYNPDARPDEPLAACYEVIHHPPVVAWVTGDGQLFYARIRTWPRYNVTSGWKSLW